MSESLNKQRLVVGRVLALLLQQQLVTTWPSSEDSSLETSSPSFLGFRLFVTSDVCVQRGFGAVITTLGAIDDGSGGRHSALFTPLLLLLLHRHPHSAAAAETVRKIQL